MAENRDYYTTNGQWANSHIWRLFVLGSLLLFRPIEALNYQLAKGVSSSSVKLAKRMTIKFERAIWIAREPRWTRLN